MVAAVELTGVEKHYGRHVAVAELSLTVTPGTVVGLVGPNGAGKTTTLRMLLDLVRPTAGRIQVLGADPRTAGPALRARIGYLPGDLRLPGRDTGRRVLADLAAASGPVRPGAVEALAERLGADLDRPVHTLSKGNRQKLGIVQAFVHAPELLVLDEPTSGLDPLVQREFLALVAEARDSGATVLLSSHVLGEVQHAADEVVVLARGRLVARGEVAALRLASVRRVRAGLAGTAVEQVGAALAPLGLQDVELTRTGDVVRVAATVEGDVDALVKVLAGFTVTDLALEEPDLEESVLRLYGSPT